MKVAFVTFEYPPHIIGGAGVHAAHITEELAKLGHQVVVFTPAIDNTTGVYHPLQVNLQVWYVPVREAIPFGAMQFWINLPAEIKRAEKNRKFDIIHINGLSYWFIPRRLSPAPHVLTVHHLVRDAAEKTGLKISQKIKDISGENGYIISQIEKRALKSVDKIIAVSNYTKNRIIQTYHIPSDMVDVVYNGVEYDGYICTEVDLDMTRKQLGLQDLPIILFVGRIDDPRKGLDILIEAFLRVIETTDAILIVVGKGDSTKFRNLIESVNNRILFTGYIEESMLKKFYILCDIYVCPSRLEGFGLTILEALTFGKPIISTKVGVIPELIDNEIGILVENENPSQIYDALMTLISDRTKGNMITKEVKEKFQKKFSWETCAALTEKTYENAIKLH